MYDWYFGEHQTPQDLAKAEMQVLLGVGGFALFVIVFSIVCALWLNGLI